MTAQKATALVLRTVDWSDTSRIATLWTREFGKVRVLAKGGRRLKSNFESALDLLTVCSIVLLRKSSASLDLLTEARVVSGGGLQSGAEGVRRLPDTGQTARTDVQSGRRGRAVSELPNTLSGQRAVGRGNPGSPAGAARVARRLATFMESGRAQGCAA